jgi:hypothetical protein
MLIECFRDMRLVIVYRTQLSMFFFHVIDETNVSRDERDMDPTRLG